MGKGDRDEDIRKLGEALGCDLHACRTDQIKSCVERLGPAEATQLAETCDDLLGSKQLVERERDRVALAKTVVALLPHSLETVSRRLRARVGPLPHEVRFSLLCFLDAAARESADTRRAVLAAIEHFLLHVETDDASAAWMAAHLLAEHWPGDDSLNVLVEAARSANYPAGRYAAIQGMEERSSSGDTQQRERVSQLLEELLETERDPAVRGLIEVALRPSSA